MDADLRTLEHFELLWKQQMALHECHVLFFRNAFTLEVLDGSDLPSDWVLLHLHAVDRHKDDLKGRQHQSNSMPLLLQPVTLATLK